jgi:hypothetical protein
VTTEAQIPRQKKKRPQYFDDPAIDKLAAIVVELAAQVWVLKDRERILEMQLEKKGQISRADIDYYQPTDEEQDEIRKERDQFISRLFKDITSDLS